MLAQNMRREIVQALDKQSQARTIEHPANESGKEQAHSLRGPLGWLTREERNKDKTDSHPEHEATDSCHHHTLCIGLGSRTKGQGKADAHNAPEKDTDRIVWQREHQDDAAACSCQQANQAPPSISIHTGTPCNRFDEGTP